MDEIREFFSNRPRDRPFNNPVQNPQPIEPLPQQQNAPQNGLREEMIREVERLHNMLRGNQDKEKLCQNRPIYALPTERLSEKDFKYYRQTHGFNPRSEAILIPKTPGYYKYESLFDLTQDRPLKEAGVYIGARVEVKERIYNRIFFRRGNKESTVDCVHTAICTIGAQDALSLVDSIEEDANNVKSLLERAISTEMRPVFLPPEEHFVSLKSYVAGIAEMGLVQVMFAAYHSDGVNPETLPFGFNCHLQRQLARALRDVAPTSTMTIVRDLVIELVQSVPEDWFRTRLRLLDEMYNIRTCILTDPVVFDAVYSAAPCQELLLFGAQFQDLHPAVLNRIAKLGDSRVRASLVKNSSLKAEDLVVFSQDSLAEVRLGVARHPQTPLQILRTLMRDPEFFVRKAVAQNPLTTTEILVSLLNDKDASVRVSAQERLVSNPSIQAQLNTNRQGSEVLPRFYQGVSLPTPECFALADIERAIGASIPYIPDLGAHELGFSAQGEHVVKLRVTQTDLQVIPVSVGNFTYLRELDLSCNHLTELPSSLARLQQLQYLDLSVNDLTVIPPFFDLWMSIIVPKHCDTKLLQRNKTRRHTSVPLRTTQDENLGVKYFNVLDPGTEKTRVNLERDILQRLRNVIGRRVT